MKREDATRQLLPTVVPGVREVGAAERQPDGSQIFLTTRWEKLLDAARKNSLWPFPFGTACCAIEFMSVVMSHYDLARFGAEVVRFSPRQSDLLIVAGTVTDKMAPVLVRIYEQMAEPKYVISMGACACTGGFYRAYHVVQGIDEFIPVDVYVPGCPPTPEALLRGVVRLQEMIGSGETQYQRNVAAQKAAASVGE
ncbi:MAG: NADH-quinone oxidoreductase subunit B [Acidobacteria bacterium]|nr:NADH-quinone oxidoreductase subunit B [Acidobacteriota bacterium]